MYPVLLIDAITVKVRDAQVANRPAYNTPANIQRKGIVREDLGVLAVLARGVGVEAPCDLLYHSSSES